MPVTERLGESSKGQVSYQLKQGKLNVGLWALWVCGTTEICKAEAGMKPYFKQDHS